MNARTTVKQILSHVRSFILWVVWVMLLVIWVATLMRHLEQHDSAPLTLAVTALVLLVLLSFAEGMELAVADLLDKDVSQVSDRRTRELLSAIQQRSGFFFAQRQVFVVLIVSFTSLATSYDWIYVPFYGESRNSSVTFWFSLCFVTLTVLWFSQVTPKRLAVANSEAFLGYSTFVWTAIRLISLLGLPNPTDQLFHLAKKFGPFRHERMLLPSRSAHYNTSAHLYGFALDKLATNLIMGPGGTATIRKRFLILFLYGRHAHVYGYVDSNSVFKKMPVITLKSMHVLSTPERLESLTKTLDAIFDEDTKTLRQLGLQNRISEWVGNVDVSIDELEWEGPGQHAIWLIEGQPLPESCWPELEDDMPVRPLVAFLYEVEAECDTGAFIEVDGGFVWQETVGLPCREYDISIMSDRDAALGIAMRECRVRLVGTGTEIPEETVKLTRTAVSGKDKLKIVYPVQGAEYTLSWRAYLRKPDDSPYSYGRAPVAGVLNAPAGQGSLAGPQGDGR
jgi:hypothetical protein